MEMRIPFFDLHKQYLEISKDIGEATQQVFATSDFSSGSHVEHFENEFAAYCGTSQCVGVNSGSSALHLALLACGVGPGDEVITTPLTFIATIAAIEYCGATPVLVDCAPETLALDPTLIAEKITRRTKCIVPVHLHGRMADMAPILQLANDSRIMVIEDAAQAHGAALSARRAGSLGTLGCFSFYPSKNLGCYGEAGAVVTSDAGLARRVRMLRSWGAEERDKHEIKGFNYRMQGLQAAILGVKLQKLESWNASRQALAAFYDEALRDLPLVLPLRNPEGSNVYYVYAVRSHRRDQLRKWLTERGIGTHIHYPTPVHLQPAYRRSEYPIGSFPVAEHAAGELLSLPMFPEMLPDQIAQVCEAVRAFFKQG